METTESLRSVPYAIQHEQQISVADNKQLFINSLRVFPCLFIGIVLYTRYVIDRCTAGQGALRAAAKRLG